MVYKIKLILAAYLLSSTSAFAPSISSTGNTQYRKQRTRSTHLYAEEEGSDRRAFILGGAALVAGACFVLSNRDDSPAPTPTPGGPVDYKAVAADIGSIVRGDPNKGPTLVRLAWHSSGTYDKMAQRIAGGSEPGTMQFKEELDHGANAGLAETAVAWLEPIKQKYGSGLSYADLYTLGGVSAIKTLGGPTIPWDSGRVDAMDSSQVPPEGRLPAADSGPPGADKADAAEIRSVFGRMGFDDREAVALIGAHALGRCHVEFSGYEGPWTATPTRFNNLYYRFLIGSKWTPRDWTGKFQYEDASKNFMMLPSDLILIQDDKFKPIVDMYAADETLFFTDFSAAFHKLETLGTRNLVPTEWA